MTKSGIVFPFIEALFTKRGIMVDHHVKTLLVMSTESVDALEVRLSIALSSFRESPTDKDRHRNYLYVRTIAAVGHWRFGDAWTEVIKSELGETDETKCDVRKYGTEVGRPNFN
jgi:hypothetical protein